MSDKFYSRLDQELAGIKDAGLWKVERPFSTPQGPIVRVGDGPELLNLCANNYLGLANDSEVVAAAEDANRRWGAGLASVRFICGTQDIHKELEAETAAYFGYEDAILFAAAFDANGAVFEPLFGPDDAIISDTLNHASIIDGVRLSKARRYRYATNDMGDLERALTEAKAEGACQIVIVTDGVFSMDGTIANLGAITALAKRFDALTLVDDCHASGFLGPQGRGSAAYRGVEGQIDILTGTYGKALGGAMGGFVAAKKQVVDLLRQRARPYLFSNALAPSICGASLAAIRIARSERGDLLRAQLAENSARFRDGLESLGYDLIPGEHPIIPIMLYDAHKAQALAAALYEAGVYVTPFSFPVVPRDLARIRVQMSAALTPAHIDRALDAFASAGRKLEIIA